MGVASIASKQGLEHGEGREPRRATEKQEILRFALPLVPVPREAQQHLLRGAPWLSAFSVLEACLLADCGNSHRADQSTDDQGQRRVPTYRVHRARISCKGPLMPNQAAESQITAWLATQQDAMVALLREMVDLDSGSYNKPGHRRGRRGGPPLPRRPGHPGRNPRAAEARRLSARRGSVGRAAGQCRRQYRADGPPRHGIPRRRGRAPPIHHHATASPMAPAWPT